MVVWPYTTVVLIITTITNLMVSGRRGGRSFLGTHKRHQVAFLLKAQKTHAGLVE